MTQSEKEALAKEVGTLTDQLNAAIYRAWKAELSVTVEIVTQKFHALAGLELLDVRAYLPLEMGQDSDTGSVVARALESAGA